MPTPAACPQGRCSLHSVLSLPRGGGPEPLSVLPLPTRATGPRQQGVSAPEALLCSAAILAPPRHLGFSDVSHNSVRVTWEGTQKPSRLVRVSYVSSDGGHSGQVGADQPGA